MLDLKNSNREKVKKDIKNRYFNLSSQDVDLCFDLYLEKTKLQYEVENIRSEANIAAANQDIDKGKYIKENLKIKESQLSELNDKIKDILIKIPNILDESVPVGKDENENISIYRHGNIIFTKNHYEMDIFEDCNNFVGSRFVLLKDKFSQLERAIGCFMMDFLNKKGFTEFSVPVIMNEKGLSGSGHLPKDADNMFKIEGEEKYLIPTSEPILVNLGRDKRWDDVKRFCAFTECFRKEAGSAGKDIKGLIRVHQFKKCEMVCFAQPENSYEILEEMLNTSCEILKELNIPYEILILCSGDTPVTSAKTYDIQIPIGGKWREVASISNCTNYQSFNINCRNSKKEFLHILNGSALAVGRTLASILEINYNQETNSIKIPKILLKYLNFDEIYL